MIAPQLNRTDRKKLLVAGLTAAAIGFAKAVGGGVGRLAVEALRRGLGWHEDDDEDDDGDDGREPEASA